jgi:molybdenum cofactor synthesis domain-containing protein
MKPFKEIIPLEEARRRLDAEIVPIERTERVPLAQASGRVAAEDVVSGIDVPPFARSAMDGFAVRAADTAGAGRARPVRLRVVDRIYTAQVSRARIDPGTCAQIATGAPLPEGADAVVMVEETGGGGGDDVEIHAAVSAGQNVGRRGVDIAAGDRVARAGDWLTPSRVGAIAAVGCPVVTVYAQPRVTILSTGDEVVEPGRPLEPGQIYDVNRFTLAAVIHAHGGAALSAATAGDTTTALADALDACEQAGADLIVFSGGSSVGDRDLVAEVVAARGRMVFHGVAVKPGKPTAFARIARRDGGTTAFFGMPGNPTSCLSNAYVFLVPFLRATARLPPWVPRTVRLPLARAIASVATRHQFYTVRLENGAAVPAFKGSGEITSLSQADGYVEIPAGRTGLDAGAPVDVTLFGP